MIFEITTRLIAKFDMQFPILNEISGKRLCLFCNFYNAGSIMIKIGEEESLLHLKRRTEERKG